MGLAETSFHEGSKKSYQGEAGSSEHIDLMAIGILTEEGDVIYLVQLWPPA